MDQLALSLFDDESAEVTDNDGGWLFAPNGRQRCEHCRKRLHPFGGRLLCVNAYCPGGAAS